MCKQYPFSCVNPFFPIKKEWLSKWVEPIPTSIHNYSNSNGVGAFLFKIGFFFQHGYNLHPFPNTTTPPILEGCFLYIRDFFFPKMGIAPHPFRNTTTPILVGCFFNIYINIFKMDITHTHVQTQLLQYWWGPFFLKRYTHPRFPTRLIQNQWNPFSFKLHITHLHFPTQLIQNWWGFLFYHQVFDHRVDYERWKVLTHFEHKPLVDPKGHLVMGVSILICGFLLLYCFLITIKKKTISIQTKKC